MRLLISAAWTFWCVDVLAALIGLISNERGAGQFKTAGRVILLAILAGMLVAASLLVWAARSHSERWLQRLAFALGLPAAGLLYGLFEEAVKPSLRRLPIIRMVRMLR